jgi:lambda repressor-like predicted transcriptional regulator
MAVPAIKYLKKRNLIANQLLMKEWKLWRSRFKNYYKLPKTFSKTCQMSPKKEIKFVQKN